MIAALYVERAGAYFGIPDVDPWDESRDARLYPGPHPVVAHPPCSRWCRLAGLVEARWGHKRGEDGGCFAAALASVRRWGGVLEHPAYTDAWAAFDLPRPSRHGGWQRGTCGGWACHVEQGRYGHVAKKAAWLYAYGTDLPTLRWGSDLDSRSEALVSWCSNHTAAHENRPRVGKAEASRTPEAFRDVLIAMARSIRSNLARGRPIEPPVVFQGGVAANAGMVRALREVFELADGGTIFLDEIGKQYVMTARSKGLSERRVLYGHVFRNAMLIVIAGFPGLFISVFFGGSLIIETIFSLDGLGRLGFEAAVSRDYPVIFGTLFFFGLMGLLMGILSDLMYVWIDPRIDFERRG